MKCFLILSGLSLLSLSLSSAICAREPHDYEYWQRKLREGKIEKDQILLEILKDSVIEDERGITIGILQFRGPKDFYGDNETNKKDFQRLLLQLFKTTDLHQLRAFFEITDDEESDLLIAKMFRQIFLIYPTESVFIYKLRDELKKASEWGWKHGKDSKARAYLHLTVQEIDDILGSKVSYHIRARVKNIQPVGGIEEVAVIIEWELVEVESSYSPQKDELEATENVVETRMVREFVAKAEADKIEEDYGTKAGLPIERDAAIVLFQNLSKTTRIVENPSPHDIGTSNWERLVPLLPGGMNFVLIPAGTFEMGSVSGEREALHWDLNNNLSYENRKFFYDLNKLIDESLGPSDEKPLHSVTLRKSFWMMTTEVTQKQWEEVMGSNPSEFKGDDLPVESISWNDAQAFISKLNERNDGWTYRLPTESEWEYAARGGTKTAYFFGDNPSFLIEYGWFDDNSDKTTHPVASCPTQEKAKANAFGLYDMHGNVWELCSDWYGEYPSGNVTDPSGPVTGSHHVIRGGGWTWTGGFRGINAHSCRSAARFNVLPDFRSSSLVGFRPVRIKK